MKLGNVYAVDAMTHAGFTKPFPDEQMINEAGTFKDFETRQVDIGSFADLSQGTVIEAVDRNCAS